MVCGIHSVSSGDASFSRMRNLIPRNHDKQARATEFNEGNLGDGIL